MIQDAAQQAFAALLLDRDVFEVISHEGGSTEVHRTSSRERVGVVEGPLFALLRESGAGSDVIEVTLKHGHRLLAGPLHDGRIVLRLLKISQAADVTVAALEADSVLPPGIGAEMQAALLQGAGVLVVGPSRVGRQRTAVAVMRAVAPLLRVVGVTDSSSLVDIALKGRPIEHRASAAVALGADALFALELSVRDLASLARARPSVPLLASIDIATAEALNSALDAAGVSLLAVATNVAVVGFSPQGRPRLVELHGPTRHVDAPTSGAAPMRSHEPHHEAVVPVRALGGPTAAVYSDDPVMHAPPEAWADIGPHDDPGWELAASALSSPPTRALHDQVRAASSFDAALVKLRDSAARAPAFTPRQPSAHPQAATLRAAKADPFGGLTFEPPVSGDATETVDGSDEDPT